MSRRARVFVLAGVVAVLALLGVAAMRLAGSERGLALLVQALQRAVPGLAVEAPGGTLHEGRVGALVWRGETETVTVRDMHWQLDRGCLARFSVCFDHLSVGQLDVALSESVDDTPLDLRPLALPVDIDVALGEVASLRIRRNDDELFRADVIRLAAALVGSRVDIASLDARLFDADLHAAGRIGIEKHIPLAVTASASRAGFPAITASAKGDLRKLAVDARVAGEWPLAVSGTVEPLAEHVPLEFALRAEAPLALPGEASAVGSLTGARATLSGNLLGASAVLQADTDSTWIGRNRLEAALRWSPETGLTVQRAALRGEVGMVEASGTLGLTTALPLRIAVQLRDACLPRWVTTPGCRIGGAVQVDGTLGGAAPAMGATLDLRGEVAARSAQLRGRVAMDAAGAITLEGITLDSGVNRLELAGTVGETLAVQGKLDAASLADSLPEAQGHGRVDFRVGGTRAGPELDVTLQFAQARWLAYAAGELGATLRWRGPDASTNHIELDADGLALAGVDVHNLRARLAGSGADHTLTAAARVEGLAVDVGCTGRLRRESGDWSGNCARLDLTTREGLPDWQLDRALALAWKAAPRSLTLEPFCLRSRNTDACSTGRVRIAPEVVEGIALRAEALPVGFLSAWMPPDLQASGTLALALDASRRGAQPLRLDARVSSPRLRMEPLAAGEEVPFEFRDVDVSLRSDGGALRLRGAALAGSDGRLEAALDLGGTTPSAALSGSVTVASVDVGPVLRVVPGSLQTAGRLDGRVSLAGTVAAPSLSGELAITGGQFAHETLPQPIEDFRLALRFEGADAEFHGSLRTRAGTGDIDGALRWAGEDWSARLRLHAQELLLEPRRGTRIHVVPDITVELDPALARISGEVRIPEASIDLEGLPETAVSVSPDTVITGREKTVPGIDYTLAVDIAFGKKVHLRGFGVDAHLAGGLQLLRNPDAPLEGHGEVRIPEGRYTAYGQRLEVTEGSSLVFNGPLSRPALRINAMRRIEDDPVEVGVQVRGDAKVPELKVFSRPAMPESRALHYLLTGRAPTSGTDNELALGSAMMQLGLSGAGKVTGKILGKLGIQDFQVDSRKVQGGTEVQLSGYITPDLYLRYGVSTFEKVNTFRLRYRLTPRFFVEAVSGVENAVDFLYSFSR